MGERVAIHMMSPIMCHSFFRLSLQFLKPAVTQSQDDVLFQIVAVSKRQVTWCHWKQKEAHISRKGNFYDSMFSTHFITERFLFSIFQWKTDVGPFRSDPDHILPFTNSPLFWFPKHRNINCLPQQFSTFSHDA